MAAGAQSPRGRLAGGAGGQPGAGGGPPALSLGGGHAQKAAGITGAVKQSEAAGPPERRNKWVNGWRREKDGC